MQRLDEMVLRTQKYLNSTYSGNVHWINITENGKTGWPTIRGLIRALQIETGISTPNGTFGPATEAACPTLKKDLNPSEKTKRLVYILQGAMWCKGFSPGGFTGTFGDGTENGIKKFQESAGLTGSNINGIADTMIFKALLNMDAYVLVSSGDSKIREIQMCLNRDYHKWIGLRPTDGRYGRDTNKALIYAIQVEEGIAEPNGTFGPQTQAKLPVLAPGSKNTPFVKIMQYALYCNGFDTTGFTGVFGNGTLKALKEFQAFCMLVADGYCGPATWASLLVSCGDKDRKGTACDCSQEVTDARAKTLVNNGYKIVGRYIAGGEWKKLKENEAKTIFKNGLRLFPIFQKSGNSVEYFSSSQGKLDGTEAVEAALKYGFPEGTTIYFAVDFDAVDDQVTSNILPYFRAIKVAMSKYNPRKYKIGVYGARNICSRVGNEGISTTSFVGDMSTGFSGNLGYPLPKDWAFDQIKEYSIGTGDGKIAIDNNIASGRDNGVSSISLVTSDENKDEYDEEVLQIIKDASNTGIFTGAGIEINRLDKKFLLATPSLIPYVTVEGELSLTEKLVGPYQTINFGVDSESISLSLSDAAHNAGVNLAITRKIIEKTLSSISFSQAVGPVKVSLVPSESGGLSIVLEATKICKTPSESVNVNLYQRMYITVHPSKFPTQGNFIIPVLAENENDVSQEAINNGWVMTLAATVATAGLVALAIFMCGGGYGLVTISGLFLAAAPMVDDKK